MGWVPLPDGHGTGWARVPLDDGRGTGLSDYRARSARPVRVVPPGTPAADDLRLGLAATAALAAAALRVFATDELLAALPALDRRVGDARGDELDRPDRVVVARDHEVDPVRI